MIEEAINLDGNYILTLRLKEPATNDKDYYSVLYKVSSVDGKTACSGNVFCTRGQTMNSDATKRSVYAHILFCVERYGYDSFAFALEPMKQHLSMVGVAVEAEEENEKEV